MGNPLSLFVYSNKAHDPVHCLYLLTLVRPFLARHRRKDSEAGTVLSTSQLFFCYFFVFFWNLQSQLIKKKLESPRNECGHHPGTNTIIYSSRGKSTY